MVGVRLYIANHQCGRSWKASLIQYRLPGYQKSGDIVDTATTTAEQMPQARRSLAESEHPFGCMLELQDESWRLRLKIPMQIASHPFIGTGKM